MVSDLIVAPESLMRGFFRTPTGPGWALVGDACHFKHPATAQGIGDAVEQAIYVAETLSGAVRASSPTRLARHAGLRALRVVVHMGTIPAAGDRRTYSGAGRARPTPPRTSETPSAAAWSRLE